MPRGQWLEETKLPDAWRKETCSYTTHRHQRHRRMRSNPTIKPCWWTINRLLCSCSNPWAPDTIRKAVILKLRPAAKAWQMSVGRTLSMALALTSSRIKEVLCGRRPPCSRLKNPIWRLLSLPSWCSSTPNSWTNSCRNETLTSCRALATTQTRLRIVCNSLHVCTRRSSRRGMKKLMKVVVSQFKLREYNGRELQVQLVLEGSGTGQPSNPIKTNF